MTDPTSEPMADTREMYMIHTVFRREFGLMPGLVRGVAPGDVTRAQQVADHLDLIKATLHHHHSAEDVHLWPRLLERGTDELAPLVELVEHQHEEIEKAYVEAGAAAQAWRESASADAAQALVDALDRLIPLLNQHMNTEEVHLLPLIEKYITAAEWQTMASGNADIAAEQLALIAGMAMYEGDPEVIEMVFSTLPPEVGAMLREGAPKLFAAHSLAIHGTATPPRVTEISATR